MYINLSGLNILVTGASRGIGKALAERFAAEGSKVIMVARRKDKLIEIERAIQKKGGEAISLKVDVTLMEDCRAMVEAAIGKWGRVDVLINNAGISMRALFQQTEVEVIEKVMDVNFRGTVYATKACVDAIVETKGSIVGISSIGGYRGLPGRTGYSASKFAMQGFLECLRTELIPTGVNVLIACPGFTASNIRNAALLGDGSKQGKSPLNEGKIMSAEEVAEKIYKAVVKRKRTLIMTLQGKVTVFLNKRFPGLMDKIVFNHFAKEANSPLKK